METNNTNNGANKENTMKAPTLRRQRTFTVDGEKIKIVTTRKTHLANFVGWNITINGKRYFCNLLERKAAEDHCYVRWVKEQQ